MSDHNQGTEMSSRMGKLSMNSISSVDSIDNDSSIRMLIYSHDTFGLGHLQRCLKLSGALVSHIPNLSILLATGSPVVHRYHLPKRVDYIKLPAVRKVGTQEYESRTLNVSSKRILNVRRSLLENTIREFEPDLLLVDHSPSGLKGEMIPALEWLRCHKQNCVRILGLRDIIDAPATVRSLWKNDGTYGLIDEMYDHVLVYGSRAVFDSVNEYGFPDGLKEKSVYCNYISDEAQYAEQAEPLEITPLGKKTVVVTIGGGDGAGELIIGNFLEMLRRKGDKVDFHTVILTGPFLEEELLNRFKEEGSSLSVTIESFVPSTSPYFQQSDLIVATGGYNTMTQMLSHGKRALVIPRIMFRQEQLMRANCMSRLGWINTIHPDEVSPERLFEEISVQLAEEREPLSEVRGDNPDLLSGARQVAEFCSSVIRSQGEEKVANRG